MFSENWCKFIIGSSFLLSLFGCMLRAISTEMADNSNDKFNVNYKLVSTNSDTSINVKLSEQQRIELKSKPLNQIGEYYYNDCGR